MTERKTVPVAYVTKWAQSVGIEVWRDGELRDGGYLYLQKRKGEWAPLGVSAKHWTTDKAEAEKRYRAALGKAQMAAQKKANALGARMLCAPVFSEDES